ncbi:MAG: TlpA disulfide reductase family protein [Pyrinomonadaceae bacterium]
MKQLFSKLMAFAALAVVFSAMTGCGGVQSSNTNANNTATNASAQKQPGSSDYPPLASGLADAEVEMLDGTKIKISDKKGKVLLINIWGTWCGPCIAEMPHLIALQNEHGEQGFEVIGLNIGDGGGSPEPLNDIKEFVAKQKLNYTIAIASNAVTNQFYLITKQQVVPQTILVDRAGKLRGVFVGGGPRIFSSMKQNVEKVMAE